MAKVVRSPLLPHEDAREAALFFVVAALCFLAALTALATRAGYSAATTWAGQVQGEAMVRLVEGTPEDAARLVTSLEGKTGIEAARVEDRDETERLLSPWLGRDLPEDLPIPVYVQVRGLGEARVIESSIQAAADDIGLEVDIDIFADWAGDLQRVLGIVRIAGIIALMLLCTIVISVIAFATHAALLARRDVVTVLHTCGASDRFISRLFEYRFFGLGLKAGIMGSLFALFGALLLFFLAQQGEDRTGLLPQLAPDFGTLVILVLTPTLSALVAMIAARVTVTRALSELT